jgi:hypothetical protein
MNQTGLSESMVPSNLSLLFKKSPYEDCFIKPTLEEIPSSIVPIKKNKIPVVFDIMPLFKTPHTINIDENQMIPICSKCGAFPNEFCRFYEATWKCSICNATNNVKNEHILPDSADYQILISKEAVKKPLFLFVIQMSRTFSQCAENINKVILNWCHMERNKGVEIALATIDSNITVYDLKHSKAHALIDVDNFKLPVCEAQDVDFEIRESSELPSPSNFFELLNHVLNATGNREFVNVVLFVEDCSSESGYADVLGYFKSVKRILHLFASKSSQINELALLSYRVRLFDYKEAAIVAPILSSWLQSGALFGTSIQFYYNSQSFGDNFITTRYSNAGDNVYIPFIDGESAFSIETKYKRGTQRNSFFQVTLLFTFSNGTSGMRVISWRTNNTTALTSLDGVCFGVQLARDCANSMDVEKQQDHYHDFFETCIELVSAWSEEGAYIKKIDKMFRDVPLLMNSISKSPLFGSNKLETIAAKVNYLTMSPARVCRSLYPVLILPPFNFPQRLTKEKVKGFEAALIIGPFSGKAYGKQELLSSVEVFKVPFLLEDKIEPIIENLVEDINPSFTQFNEKIEIECNGRRFV